MVDGILELVVESSSGMLAMVVRDGRIDTTHKKKIKHHKRKEKATHQRVVAQTKARKMDRMDDVWILPRLSIHPPRRLSCSWLFCEHP
jgi:hypothetical protein